MRFKIDIIKLFFTEVGLICTPTVKMDCQIFWSVLIHFIGILMFMSIIMQSYLFFSNLI